MRSIWRILLAICILPEKGVFASDVTLTVRIPVCYPSPGASGLGGSGGSGGAGGSGAADGASGNNGSGEGSGDGGIGGAR